jgi:hypothetical protein
MRTLYAPDYVSGSTWRLRLKDEVQDLSDSISNCGDESKELLLRADRVMQRVMDPASTPEQASKITSDFMIECAPVICQSRIVHSASRLSKGKTKQIAE